jgi:hypothetical protein
VLAIEKNSGKKMQLNWGTKNNRVGEQRNVNVFVTGLMPLSYLSQRLITCRDTHPLPITLELGFLACLFQRRPI